MTRLAVGLLLLLAAWLCPAVAAEQNCGGGSTFAYGCTSYNGSGSTTHSVVTTPYGTGGQLFANNVSGDAVASQITVTGMNAGTGLISKGIIQSSGTNAPPTVVLWLFSAAPITTGLVDGSTYVGPYAADITGGNYIGSLTCSTWNKTNDASAQYFSECTVSSLALSVLPFRAVAGQTYLYALEEINGAYTPLSGETHTYLLSTLRDN
jgi:hypothetical protein